MDAQSKKNFILEPFQEKVPHHPKMSAQESSLMTKEVESMLKKEVIQKTSVKKGQFLNNLFLVGKKDRGKQTYDKLIESECIQLDIHFTMEGLHLLKNMPKEKDYMGKIDLKNVYCCVPLH